MDLAVAVAPVPALRLSLLTLNAQEDGTLLAPLGMLSWVRRRRVLQRRGVLSTMRLLRSSLVIAILGLASACTASNGRIGPPPSVHPSDNQAAEGIASSGGKGGGSAQRNLQSAPGDAAIAEYLQASHRYSFNSKYEDHNFNLRMSSIPNPGTTTFNGTAPAYSTVDTLKLYEDGELVDSSVVTEYHLLNPYVPLGDVDGSGGTSVGVVTSSFPLPKTIHVGDSGAIDNTTYYHDSTKSVVDAEETSTYSVAVNDATALMLCIHTTTSNVSAQGIADGMANHTESDCYTVTSAGKATLVSITLTVNGATLKFQ